MYASHSKPVRAEFTFIHTAMWAVIGAALLAACEPKILEPTYEDMIADRK